MAETHDKKSHDYASDSNPSGNYHFAGTLAILFSHSPEDAGFVGRLGEKIYRLSNLEKSGKVAKNESIDDTERDIATITTLWMADRRNRRITLEGRAALSLNDYRCSHENGWCRGIRCHPYQGIDHVNVEDTKVKENKK